MPGRRRQAPPADEPLAICARSLGELAGAVLVLDAGLRVVVASPAAERLLGGVRRGDSAPAILCGGAIERPIAEALAAGRAITATIPRPATDGRELLVRVRTLPLGRPTGGWILLADTEGARAEGETFHGMFSADPGMSRLFRLIEKVARVESSVLVRGETGAGKELVARALHDCSPRARGQFRAINCAALPANLLESELFGHVRGAFTGALRDNPGHFRQASGGTLFLDEVAELPLDLQAKLLRVLESREVFPVGAAEPVPVDVRVLAATHRALRAEVAAGRFRADLLFRLRVVPLFLPPLRARAGDVRLLALRFVEELNARGGRRVERVTDGALARLERHDWPGNIRELRNVLEYAFAVGDGPLLTEADLPPEVGDPASDPERTASASNVPPALAAPADAPPETTRILRALERAGENRERAARLLGISRATLWRRMRALGLVS